jgi:hypothetical protein
MNGKLMLAGATMMTAAMSAQSGYTPSMEAKYSFNNFIDYAPKHYQGRSNRTASTRKIAVAKRNAARRAQRKSRRNNRHK